ncbi:MAG TPA: metal-dependent transcriptional regulator [Gemmatimonadales bacterium]|jgi:DtxR family Mn-dependent transcriptional regulator|nr:metal-dependent transcriptional regulator [Gemmatimonadales bacterium]
MLAAVKDPELTRSTEDYLKVIFELETVTGAAQTSAIADALAVAPASVSGMVKRLSESGLLAHVPYKGVQLTETGKRAALRMVRRHRILETYLTSKLGYDWDSVHQEAERLEHAVSDGLIERMAMALGNPRHDPHGAPIPTPAGHIEEEELIALSDVPEGELAELRRVSDKDPELLRYLASLGLKPGVSIEVGVRQPFRGPLAVRVAGPMPRELVIGHELAAALFCDVVTKEAG